MPSSGSGAIVLDDYALTGDAAAIDTDSELALEAHRTAEILVLDLD